MRAAAVLCVLLLAACEGRTSQATSASADSVPTADTAASDTTSLTTLDCAQFIEQALRVQPTRAELHAAFGAPDSVRAATEPNRHLPDVTDSLFVVHYDGLMVEIRKPYGGLDMPDFVQVTDNRYLARAGIGIGAPAQRVVTVLGEPRERSAERLRWECGEVGAPVTFVLANDTVRALELDYYVD